MIEPWLVMIKQNWLCPINTFIFSDVHNGLNLHSAWKNW